MKDKADQVDRPYDDLLAAMQSEMLTIDEDYAGQWVTTMRDLVNAKLDHNEFTRRRMDALHEWERRRKAAQARLRWKYDGTGRRKPSLVERDVVAQLAKVRAQMASLKDAIAPATSSVEVPSTGRPVSPESRPRIRDTPVHELQEPIRSLDGLNPFSLQMLTDCTGLDPDDLENATDEEVLRACMVHSHIDQAAAQQYVDILNGTFQTS